MSDLLNCVNNTGIDNMNVTVLLHMRTLKSQQTK